MQENPLIPFLRGPLDDQEDRSLGGTVSVQPGAKGVSLFSLKSDAAPALCAIAISPDLDPSCPVGPNAADAAEDQFLFSALRAVIEFGIGSATQCVVCDVVKGTVLAIPLQAVKVTLSYVLERPSWMSGDLQPSCVGLPTYRVTGGIAYTAAGHNQNPARYTEFVAIENTTPGAEPPTDKARIRIPEFAVGFTVLPALGGTCTVEILSTSSQFPVQVDITGPLTNQGFHLTENAIPLPAGARWLEITNTNSSGDSFYGYVVFGLAT